MSGLKSTRIKRGQHPILHSELTPNFTYAVTFVLPSELIPEWSNEYIKQWGSEQWGIIQLDSQGRVRRSYNVATPGAWSDAEVKLDGLKVYRASLMERQFADTSENEFSFTIKCRQMAARLTDVQRQLDHANYLLGTRWHRIAECLRKFFSI